MNIGGQTRARVYVCVCVSQWKKVPDEWQARQATPAILQVSSSKQNAKNITTSVCVCVPSVSALDWWGYYLINMWIEREYNVEKTGRQTERKTAIPVCLWCRPTAKQTMHGERLGMEKTRKKWRWCCRLKLLLRRRIRDSLGAVSSWINEVLRKDDIDYCQKMCDKPFG